MPKQAQIWLGSPRDLLKHLGDPGYEPPKADGQLHFEVKKMGKDAQPLQWLMNLLPDNTLIGCADDIPGIVGDSLPPKPEMLLAQ